MQIYVTCYYVLHTTLLSGYYIGLNGFIINLSGLPDASAVFLASEVA